jgi:hypothetical protein
MYAGLAEHFKNPVRAHLDKLYCQKDDLDKLCYNQQPLSSVVSVLQKACC